MSEQPKTLEKAISELDTPEVRDVDFDVLFDESPTGIAFVHHDGTFLRANGTFCSLVGYSAAELVRRRRAYDITHPDDVDAERAETVKLLSGETDRYQLTKRFLTKRGHVVWATSYVTPVKDKADVFIHFVAHTTALPLSEDFYRIETTASGEAAIRPFYPLARLIRDNWKIVSMAAVTILGSLGTFGRNYIAMREEAVRSIQTIENQKGEIESLKRHVDRISRKTGVE